MPRMPSHNLNRLRFLLTASLFAFATVTTTHAQSLRPAPEQQLAHDIYKDFIEIRSGYTTGATTPVAEAAAS